MRPQGETLQHYIGKLLTLKCEMECFQFSKHSFCTCNIFGKIAPQASDNIGWQDVNLVQLKQPIVEIQCQAAGIEPLEEPLPLFSRELL